MPNFNKSTGFQLKGGKNPFQKNFPGAFKQEMTEDEKQAAIRQAMEFNEGKGAEVTTISKETSDKAKELGIITKDDESGSWSYNRDNARNAMKEAGMGLDPKFYPEEAKDVAEVNKVIEAYTDGEGFTGSKY